jgi:uncharacterized phage protein (TIGR01671 family)
MKRTIKFRGKRVDNGEWIYGLVFNYSSYNNIITYIQDGEYAVKNGSIYGWAVDPETVGQFTGLIDKNGEEIYEGDMVKKEIILKSDFGHPDKDISHFYEVVFGQNILNINGFYWKHKGKLLHGSPNDLEVIGNIHEA